ncbi:MAG: putative transposase [Actinomycetota bacterium]|nr:putative transposase [Actinomycetota bacterium]
MIARLKADFPVTYLCRKLGVSPSGFYDWSVSRLTATYLRRNDLTELVLLEFANSLQVAGYRKVTAALRRDGERVNRKTVAGIMNGLGLRSAAAEKAFRRAKSRAARVKDPVDLLKRDFTALAPGTILVGDITYVPTKEGWLYVATVIDLASRAVLGFATGSRMTTELITRAMTAARNTGFVKRSAVFHSDHGTQYRSKQFANYCGRHGIRRSMGGRMECWDNAAAESFFSKLKGERLDWLTFTTRKAAADEVGAYIDHFNNYRLHQTLDYKTPAEKIAELTAA